jgi:hypothetical protein
MVDITRAAISAARRDAICRPSRYNTITMPIPASAEGSLAANSLSPTALNAAACAQKRRIGFSNRGTPLKYGVRKSPRWNIWRVASAKRGSSGSQNVPFPTPTRIVRVAMTRMIERSRALT